MPRRLRTRALWMKCRRLLHLSELIRDRSPWRSAASWNRPRKKPRKKRVSFRRRHLNLSWSAIGTPRKKWPKRKKKSRQRGDLRAKIKKTRPPQKRSGNQRATVAPAIGAQADSSKLRQISRATPGSPKKKRRNWWPPRPRQAIG